MTGFEHPCSNCGEDGYYHDTSAWEEPCIMCCDYVPEPVSRCCRDCGVRVNSWWKSDQCPRHFLPSEYGGGCEGLMEPIL